MCSLLCNSLADVEPYLQHRTDTALSSIPPCPGGASGSHPTTPHTGNMAAQPRFREMDVQTGLSLRNGYASGSQQQPDACETRDHGVGCMEQEDDHDDGGGYEAGGYEEEEEHLGGSVAPAFTAVTATAADGGGPSVKAAAKPRKSHTVSREKDEMNKRKSLAGELWVALSSPASFTPPLALSHYR